jgi:hypothetical protein
MKRKNKTLCERCQCNNCKELRKNIKFCIKFNKGCDKLIETLRKVRRQNEKKK